MVTPRKAATSTPSPMLLTPSSRSTDPTQKLQYGMSSKSNVMSKSNVISKSNVMSKTNVMSKSNVTSNMDKTTFRTLLLECLQDENDVHSTAIVDALYTAFTSQRHKY